MSNHFEKIKDILKYEYEGKMLDEMINELAESLNDSVFVEKYDLDDIFAVIGDFEEQADIEDSKAFYIFQSLVDMLENGEDTANRLYESFMNSVELFETFLKLVNENEEYISAEKIAKAKEKAFEVFDKHLLEMYGITK